MTLFMFVCIYFGIWNRGISCIGTHDEGYTGKKNPLKLQHPLAPDETSVCVWNKRASLSLSLTYRRAKSFFLPSTLVFLVSHQLGCSVRGWKRSIITRLSADWSATVARSRIGLERSASPLLPFWELPPPPFHCSCSSSSVSILAKMCHKSIILWLYFPFSHIQLECPRIWKSELWSTCHPAQSSLFSLKESRSVSRSDRALCIIFHAVTADYQDVQLQGRSGQ